MRRHTPHEVEPTDFVESVSRPWLWGFWNPRHESPGPVTLVFGDKEQFNADREAARARATQRLDRLAKRKWEIIEEWPDGLFALEHSA